MLYVTRLHIGVNISTKHHEDTFITCEVMAGTRYKLKKFDQSVTLTFDIESYVLYATCLHIRVNIVTIFEDKTITCKVKVMDGTRYTL